MRALILEQSVQSAPHLRRWERRGDWGRPTRLGGGWGRLGGDWGRLGGWEQRGWAVNWAATVGDWPAGDGRRLVR